MPSGELQVRHRPAVVSDADELGRLHVATWRAGYAGLLPPEFLAGLSVADRSARWREILGAGGGGNTTVAVAEERLVGFVSSGPPLAESPPGTGWLYALYVDRELWGTGVGYRLHELGVESMQSAGFRRAELWVLRTNLRAIGFYERQGWAPDGREQLDDHLPGVELDEIGMTRPLV